MGAGLVDDMGFRIPGTTPPRGPIRAVLADDHPAFRAGLRAILADVPYPGVDIVGEAASGPAAVALAAELRPDLVLMDLQMSGGDDTDGIDATRRITAASPVTGVLVVSVFSDPAGVRAALAAGARGYVLKGAAAGEIVGAVRAVASGCAFLGTGVAALLATLAGETRPTPRPGIPGLTERESDVLRLLSTGLGTGDIARNLRLTPKTVRQPHVQPLRQAGRHQPHPRRDPGPRGGLDGGVRRPTRAMGDGSRGRRSRGRRPGTRRIRREVPRPRPQPGWPVGRACGVTPRGNPVPPAGHGCFVNAVERPGGVAGCRRTVLPAFVSSSVRCVHPPDKPAEAGVPSRTAAVVSRGRLRVLGAGAWQAVHTTGSREAFAWPSSTTPPSPPPSSSCSRRGCRGGAGIAAGRCPCWCGSGVGFGWTIRPGRSVSSSPWWRRRRGRAWSPTSCR
ncbi:response regulator transcription factor [Yinghuangia aomiensis]